MFSSKFQLKIFIFILILIFQLFISQIWNRNRQETTSAKKSNIFAGFKIPKKPKSEAVATPTETQIEIPFGWDSIEEFQSF